MDRVCLKLHRWIDLALLVGEAWPPSLSFVGEAKADYVPSEASGMPATLFDVWIGALDLAEVPGILLEWSLCSKREAHQMRRVLEKQKPDREELIASIVRRSYRAWYGQPKCN